MIRVILARIIIKGWIKGGSKGPKPRSSMISGFLTPEEPLSMEFNMPRYLKQIKKIIETLSKNMIVNQFKDSIGIIFQKIESENDFKQGKGIPPQTLPR